MRGVAVVVVCAGLIAGCEPSGLRFIDPPMNQKAGSIWSIRVAFVDGGGDVVSSDDYIQIFLSNMNQDAGVVFIGDRDKAQAKDGIAFFQGLEITKPVQGVVLEAEWKDQIEPSEPFDIVP